jgi:DNA-binding MarR family transcriptional regulator
MELEYFLSKISGFYDQNIRKFKEEAIGSDEVDHLTLHHWNYVEMIHELGNPTFTELAERLGVTKPSVTAIANKLIRQGYLYKRQSSEDRRTYHLYLSEKGKRLIEAEHKAVIEFANQIRYALSDAEINQLVEMFKKVVASFSQK